MEKSVRAGQPRTFRDPFAEGLCFAEMSGGYEGRWEIKEQRWG